MIIPAACIVSVVGFVILGVRVTSVNVSTKVLRRDGISLIACEFVLILLINGTRLHWWQGLILMVIYGMYLAFMLATMKATPAQDMPEESSRRQDDDRAEPSSWMGRVFYWMSGGPLLDLEALFVKDRHRQQIEQETWNGWGLLIASTAVIGVACWLLVTACQWLGTGPGNEIHPHYVLFGRQYTGFGMPAMFVAVIFASMATSVPDTVMSIRDARDGDYDDAVANALGSNIFDICFALGFPLFLFTLIHGPIVMSEDIAQQSGELRLLLLALTIVGFLVYYLGKRGTTAGGVPYVEMKKGKAVILLLIYVVFVAYIIARSQDLAWAQELSGLLRSVLDRLPRWG
jgi:cation:H+ antiporter